MITDFLRTSIEEAYLAGIEAAEGAIPLKHENEYTKGLHHPYNEARTEILSRIKTLKEELGGV